MDTLRRAISKSNALLLLTCLFSTNLAVSRTTAQVANLNMLHNFKSYPDGAGPTGRLVLCWDGNYYGITQYGGDYGVGTIFRITPDGSFTTLHTFTGGSDGTTPQCLIRARGGNLFGLTSTTFFRITLKGVFTTLHTFTTGDGLSPNSLIQGQDGTFYGTMGRGSANGYGNVFHIVPAMWQFSTLHAFNKSDGADPESLIVKGTVLYGTTQSGGANAGGVLFCLNTDGSSFSDLHDFSFYVDGEQPQGLIVGRNGNIFGATAYGGPDEGGIFFSLNPNGNTFTRLHSLAYKTDGYYAQGFIQNRDNTFYGVTYLGGPGYVGTLFKMNADGSNFTTTYTFTDRIYGANPQGLTPGSDGYFYGAAYRGGNGRGTVFKTTPNGDLTLLYTLTGNTDGAYTQDMAQGWDGNFYGVTYQGGTYNAGTIFKQTPGGGITTLYSFTNGDDGGTPSSAPILGQDGNLYGTIFVGGNYGSGMLYRLTPAGVLTVLHVFTLNDGVNPNGLVQHPNGLLYGTTFAGGNYGYDSTGTVYSITPDGKQFNVLYTFLTSSVGGYPLGSLIVGKDGALYGTTLGGAAYGFSGYGSIFKITTQGQLTTLYSCTTPSVAANPIGTLTQDTNGTLYGVCVGTGSGSSNSGSLNGYGSIFRIEPNGNGFTNLHTFTGGSDGGMSTGYFEFPVQNHLLAYNTDGALYGVATYLGANLGGVLFKSRTDGSNFNVLDSFGADQGINPMSLLSAGDGTLYGTAVNGGTGNQGTVFQFTP